MTATRWPVHPAPIPGEAASSWLTRLAAALHIDAGVLLDDLGYHPNTMVELDDLTIACPPGWPAGWQPAPERPPTGSAAHVWPATGPG
jgi:hypothetical protein